MADYSGPMSLSQARDLSHTSDDEDEEHSPRSAPPFARPSRARITINRAAAASGGGTEIMGSAAEVNTRKPRGRPPGSKNKPKPPVVLTRESDSAMKSAVLEISAGSDVIETVVQFARRRHLGVSIISGSGSVSNVTLRHPSSHAPSLTLHGPFNILTLTGTYLGSSPSSSSPPPPPPPPPPSSSSSSSSGSFGISLAGQQGQVFGGVVGGKVIAASPVVLVVATFMNPTFHRLPGGEMVEEGVGEDQGKAARVGGSGSEGCSNTSMSMSAYGVSSPAPLNCHAPSDVLTWGGGPSSRPPQPY